MSDGCEPHTVVLADDDDLLREGVASLLDRSGLEVVGQVGHAVELIETVSRQRPELALVDIRMPPKHTADGLDAARVIQQEFPETVVVVLSARALKSSTRWTCWLAGIAPGTC